MMTVRKRVLNILLLAVTVAGIVVLTYYANLSDAVFFDGVRDVLNMRTLFGVPHQFVMTLAFMSVVLSVFVKMVYFDVEFGYLLRCFFLPILFTGGVAIWVLVYINDTVNPRWFVFYYYIALIITMRIMFADLSKINGAGSPWILEFLSKLTKKTVPSVNIVDRIFLSSFKCFLSAILLVTVVMCGMFCYDNRVMFELLLGFGFV